MPLLNFNKKRDLARPDDPGGKDEALLYERLRRLVDRLGSSLNAAEFLDRLLELMGDGGKRRPSVSLEDACLAVLTRRGCPSTLLAQVDRLLRSSHPRRTVKAAARDAGVDRKTLDRQWRGICADHDLHDLFRLIRLVHVVRASGSEGDRARTVEIDVRTARSASLDLVLSPLLALLHEPADIIRALEGWFPSDVPPLS